MQHFKKHYSDPSFKNTFSNIQQCLRLNDLQDISDGTHFLLFEMIGLFSFKQWTLEKSIQFMLDFLKKLSLYPDYVTIHPDKISQWRHIYDNLNIPIKEDVECYWNDGDIGGFCTEFYINDVEIGNIVNTLDHSIDIGFGLERLLHVSNYLQSKSRLQILEETCNHLISEGITISHSKQGYILKKLITECVLSGSQQQHPYFIDIKNRLVSTYSKYLKSHTQKSLMNKTNEYWHSTLGLDMNRLSDYQKLLT